MTVYWRGTNYDPSWISIRQDSESHPQGEVMTAGRETLLVKRKLGILKTWDHLRMGKKISHQSQSRTWVSFSKNVWRVSVNWDVGKGWGIGASWVGTANMGTTSTQMTDCEVKGNSNGWHCPEAPITRNLQNSSSLGKHRRRQQHRKARTPDIRWETEREYLKRNSIYCYLKLKLGSTTDNQGHSTSGSRYDF